MIPALQRLYNTEEMIDDFANRLPLDQFNQLLLSGYKAQRNKFGIFCATSAPDNEAMWNAYAEMDTGICIEFTFPTLFNKLFYAFQVCYDTVFSALDLLDTDGRQKDAVVQRWLFTKRHYYRHEREIRLCSNVLKGVHPIDKSFITSIHFGKKTTADNKKQIETIVRNMNYSLQIKNF